MAPVIEFLPAGAVLVAWGEISDGPLEPAAWEVWLGGAGWRNADDMLDARPGYGDLAACTNGVHIVMRPARPDTPRLPPTGRQMADTAIANGATSVRMYPGDAIAFTGTCPGCQQERLIVSAFGLRCVICWVRGTGSNARALTAGPPPKPRPAGEWWDCETGCGRLIHGVALYCCASCAHAGSSSAPFTGHTEQCDTVHEFRSNAARLGWHG